MIRIPLLLTVALAAIVTTAAAAGAQTSGKVLFDAHCARCHNVGGTGGEGPNLAVPVLRHAPDDESLAAVMRGGIPNTEMPGNFMLGDAEVTSLVTYVRSLGRVEPGSVPGDAASGKSLFDGKGACAVCHIVDGVGGTVGPDLSSVGVLRGTDYLRESLSDPGASVPEKFVNVRAVTRDGTEVEGVRVNEDSFTVQLRDARGRIHSLEKKTLRAFEKKFGESLMPSYEGQLSPSEIDDVVAFLTDLKGER